MSTQLQFASDNDNYLRCLDIARREHKRPESVKRVLQTELDFSKLTRTDVQTIWRAVYRTWNTPFDS